MGKEELRDFIFEEEINNIFYNLNACSWYMDNERRITRITPSFGNIFQTSVEQVIQEPSLLFSFFDIPVKKKILDFKNNSSPGECLLFFSTIKTPEGKEKELAICLKHAFGEKENNSFFRGMAIDITREKNADEEGLKKLFSDLEGYLTDKGDLSTISL